MAYLWKVYESFAFVNCFESSGSRAALILDVLQDGVGAGPQLDEGDIRDRSLTTSQGGGGFQKSVVFQNWTPPKKILR